MNSKFILVTIAVVAVSLGIVQSFATPQITFDADKGTYNPGDTVTITGKVENTPNQLVAIEVKDPSGSTIVLRTVQTDSSGNYQLQFKLPPSAAPGAYNIVSSSNVDGTMVTQTKSISEAAQATPQTPYAGKCIIATAAFGSESAPQVQFLRGIRDNNILSTQTGSSFMTAFNDVYYSFSPHVADSERQNPYLQNTIRTGIYPMLGILEASQISQITKSEVSVIGTGIMVSSLLGATYLWPAGLAFKSVRKGITPNIKLALGAVMVSVISVLSSLMFSNPIAMMISTSILVLSTAAVSALFSAWGIARLAQKIRNKKHDLMNF